MLLNTHSHDSSLREQLLQHLVVGDLLRSLWRRGMRDIEVLKAEVDRGGYDVVVECNGVLRHIQFKSSHLGASTADVTISLNLARKPCGCVIWIWFDPNTLATGPYLWFGARPSEMLPELGEKVARHTRGSTTRGKGERPNHRILRKTQFESLQTMEELIAALFGELPRAF
jgi:hypothetical protein